MNSKRWYQTKGFILGVVLAIGGTAWAVDEKIRQDNLILGNAATGADKSLTFDTGDGSGNKALTIDGSTKQASINTDDLTIGDATPSNKQIIFDRGSGAGNGRFRWNQADLVLEFSNDGSTFKEIGSGSGGAGSATGTDNQMVNIGFEDGLADWTATGSSSFVITTVTGEVGFGLQSAKWNASTGGEFLNSVDTTPVNISLGRACIAKIEYRGNASDINIRVIDGSNIVISLEVDLVDAGSTYRRGEVTFICPTSGTMALELVSGSNTPEIIVDEMFIGENFNVASTQAPPEFFGSSKWDTAASCQWLRSSWAGYQAFTVDADCSDPTVTGGLSVPATKIPQIRMDNLRVGRYVVHIQGAFYATDNGGGQRARWRLRDTVTGQVLTEQHGGKEPGTVTGHFLIPGALTGQFEVTAPGSNALIDIESLGDGGLEQTVVDLTGSSSSNLLYAYVIFYPSSLTSTVRTQTNAETFRGRHSSDCLWATASDTVVQFAGDASCTFITSEDVNMNVSPFLVSGDDIPGIKWTPQTSGKYYIGITVTSARNNGGSGGGFVLVLTDASTTYAVQRGRNEPSSTNLNHPVHFSTIVDGTAGSEIALEIKGKRTQGVGSANIEGGDEGFMIAWSIHKLTQQVPAPVLVEPPNQVVTKAAAVHRVEHIRFGGGGANSNCTSTPCTIKVQSDWVGSVVRNSLGNYTVNVLSAFNDRPSCTCSCEEHGVDVRSCIVFMGTGDTTVSTVRVTCSDLGVGAKDAEITVLCMGEE